MNLLKTRIFLIEPHAETRHLNREKTLVEEWIKNNPQAAQNIKIMVSEAKPFGSLILASKVLYREEKIGLLSLYAHIPAFKVSSGEDSLTRNLLCPPVSTSDELFQCLQCTIDYSLEKQGIKHQWKTRFEAVVMNVIKKPQETFKLSQLWKIILAVNILFFSVVIGSLIFKIHKLKQLT